MPRSERSGRSGRSSVSGYRKAPSARRGRDRDSDTSSRTSAMMLEEKIFEKDDYDRVPSAMAQLNSQRSRRSVRSDRSRGDSRVSFYGSEYSSEGGESKRTTFLSQAIGAKESSREHLEGSPSELGSNRPDRTNIGQEYGSFTQTSRSVSRQPSRRASFSRQDRTSPANPNLSQWEVGTIYPVVEGRLYFCVSERNLQSKFSDEYFFFKSELAAEYRSYFKDFGPVKLSVIYRFCQLLHKMTSAKRYLDKKLVLQMQEMPEIRTNAAFLMASYLVLKRRFTPEDACAPFTGFDVEPFMHYRDATFLHPDFTISILDCVKGLKKAADRGWFNVESFDIDEYEFYEKHENGFLNRMCDKFVAFNGPVTGGDAKEFALPPDDYIEPLLRMNVTAVIRLNEPMYSTDVFAQAGIKHYELYFRDSTTPHEGICERFFQICTQEEGRVGVHCKSGQGRTGTMIALWYMHNCGFKAKEAIAWTRLVRPGCVIGPQQDFLHAREGKKAPSRRNSVVLAHNIQPKITLKEKVLRWLPFGGCRQKASKNDGVISESLTKQFSEAAKLRQKALNGLGEERRFQNSPNSFASMPTMQKDTPSSDGGAFASMPTRRARGSQSLRSAI